MKPHWPARPNHALCSLKPDTVSRTLFLFYFIFWVENVDPSTLPSGGPRKGARIRQHGKARQVTGILLYAIWRNPRQAEDQKASE